MYKFDPNIMRVGISSCLNGQKVRFDGGMAINALLFVAKNWLST